jgi:hypothetical protein
MKISKKVDTTTANSEGFCIFTDCGCVFPMGPGAWQDLPPECEDVRLWQAHEAEAQREGAEFYNYGWSTSPGGICSKTSAGRLESWISATGQILHEWRRR